MFDAARRRMDRGHEFVRSVISLEAHASCDRRLQIDPDPVGLAFGSAAAPRARPAADRRPGPGRAVRRPSVTRVNQQSACRSRRPPTSSLMSGASAQPARPALLCRLSVASRMRRARPTRSLRSHRWCRSQNSSNNSGSRQRAARRARRWRNRDPGETVRSPPWPFERRDRPGSRRPTTDRAVLGAWRGRLGARRHQEEQIDVGVRRELAASVATDRDDRNLRAWSPRVSSTERRERAVASTTRSRAARPVRKTDGASDPEVRERQCPSLPCGSARPVSAGTTQTLPSPIESVRASVTIALTTSST